MRISISNIAWSPDADPTVAALLAKHRIDAIDVAPSKYFPDVATAQPDGIATVRQQWADRGIEIVGMQALLFGTQGLNLFGEPAIRDRMLDHLRQVCRIAQGLGARFLVFGSPRNRDRSGLDDDAVLDTACAFFRELGEIAAGHGAIICLEPNPTAYNANFMTDAGSTAAIVRAVDRPAIRLQLDGGALMLNGEDADAVLAAHGDLVAHIHASEPHLAVLGDSGTDHGPISAAIRQYCPDRIVTIEMLEDKTAPIDAIDRALAFANRAYADAADE
ncbi:MAG: TIM barrel protein [Alphaproteobacteria bacterium]|nr:TIM barrel protein [Alphaproteobacteria bacterium]